MEDPDSGGTDGTPITFTATDESGKKIAGGKRETKRSIGERLKMRKANPRPVMKGDGKKRFNLTPSPKVKPVFKCTIVCDKSVGGNSKEAHKRNLAGDFDSAAGESEKEADTKSHKEDNQGSEKASSVEAEMVNTQKGGSETEIAPVESPNTLQTPAGDPFQTEPAAGNIASPETVVSQPEIAESNIGGDSLRPPMDSHTVQDTQAIVLAGSEVEFQNGKEWEEGTKSGTQTKSNIDPSWSTSTLPFVSCNENDTHLDKITAQPLLCLPPNPLNSQTPILEDVEMHVAAISDTNTLFDENFPPLSHGTTRSIAAKFEGMRHKEMLSSLGRKPEYPKEHYWRPKRGGA